MSKHYHIHVSIRGYVPNASYYADTLGDAKTLALDEREAWEKAWNTDMVVSADTMWIQGTGDLSYHCIEIVPCSDDCDPDDDNGF